VIEARLLGAQSVFRCPGYFEYIFYRSGITHKTKPSARSAGEADDRAFPPAFVPMADAGASSPMLMLSLARAVSSLPEPLSDPSKFGLELMSPQIIIRSRVALLGTQYEEVSGWMREENSFARLLKALLRG